MANTIIENGVDICKPVPCHEEPESEIVIRVYPPSIEEGDDFTVEWDINLGTGININSNILEWGTDPLDLSSSEDAIGTGPYTASISTPGDINAVYFKVKAVIDNFVFRTTLFTVVTTSSASTSSTSATA